MVQVLPYVPGFGERLAPALEQATSSIGGALMQKRALSALQQLENQDNGTSQGTGTLNQINQIGQKSANSSRLNPFKIAQREKFAIQAFGPEVGKAYGNALIEREKLAEKEASQLRLEGVRAENTRQRDLFKSNEPKVKELGDELQNLEMEDTRYARLEELYSDPSKFPNATIASLFSKDGQITPIAASQLSPEAQEALKLTIDTLQGAQGTFGGKVSNFEAATYLKRNATLFNTPEGRKRILRDLRALNELNRKHAEGILDIFEEKGGTDKISYSGAERIFRKKHKKEIEDLRKRFISGDKVQPLSDYNPAKLKGRKVMNEETGEVFESNGKEWVPVKEGK